jgi:two-component system, chemotaxis family, CheB/CheR fusion protein
VFTRSAQSAARDQLLTMLAIPNATAGGPVAQLLHDLASAATPVAQLVIDVEGILVGANTRARTMFGVTSSDMGRPFHDLEVSFRPIELRARMEQAHAESRPVVVREIERALADGQPQFLEVTVAPLTDAAGLALGTSITFADVTELGRMKVDLERSARELELANESLHSANEELATSNEELQSTNEELETTNEELQSANEELATMNEELQSANEELETMNEELLDQAKQIERSGVFLSGLINSLAVGVVVVNDEFDVIVWNRAMEDLFGLRADEASSRSLLALDIGLPVGEIGPLLHAASRAGDGGPHDVILDAVGRKGKPFRCRVTVDTLANGYSGAGGEEGARFVVLMDELPGERT